MYSCQPAAGFSYWHQGCCRSSRRHSWPETAERRFVRKALKGFSVMKACASPLRETQYHWSLRAMTERFKFASISERVLTAKVRRERDPNISICATPGGRHDIQPAAEAPTSVAAEDPSHKEVWAAAWAAISPPKLSKERCQARFCIAEQLDIC